MPELVGILLADLTAECFMLKYDEKSALPLSNAT